MQPAEDPVFHPPLWRRLKMCKTRASVWFVLFLVTIETWRCNTVIFMLEDSDMEGSLKGNGNTTILRFWRIYSNINRIVDIIFHVCQQTLLSPTHFTFISRSSDERLVCFFRKINSCPIQNVPCHLLSGSQ